MDAFPRPRVVVSKCLGFAACRYDGSTIPDPFVTRLADFVDYLPVCPEMEIGLPAPRPALRAVELEGRVRLIQTATGHDLSGEMLGFLDRFLAGLPPCDGFLLKSRSPSCGPMDVRIYLGLVKGAASRRGPGFFGGEVLRRRPGVAMEHEGRVQNFSIREHFLTRLFVMARFRQTAGGGGLGELQDFHARHKLLLLAYHQEELRRLGRIAANPEQRPAAEVLAEYGRHLALALARAPRFIRHQNVLEHAAGYFKRALSTEEKAFFQDQLTRYRAGKLPLATLQVLLRSWIARFGEPYLAAQHYFAPYPDGLFSLAHSGKGREA